MVAPAAACASRPGAPSSASRLQGLGKRDRSRALGREARRSSLLVRRLRSRRTAAAPHVEEQALDPRGIRPNVRLHESAAPGVSRDEGHRIPVVPDPREPFRARRLLEAARVPLDGEGNGPPGARARTRRARGRARAGSANASTCLFLLGGVAASVRSVDSRPTSAMAAPFAHLADARAASRRTAAGWSRRRDRANPERYARGGGTSGETPRPRRSPTRRGMDTRWGRSDAWTRRASSGESTTVVPHARVAAHGP